MLSVDTNIIVRLIVDDDPKQSRIIRAMLRDEPFWIGKTIILEMIWVLRSTYRYDTSTIQEFLEVLVSMENVKVEDEDQMIQALDLMSHGVDPADAMHLASTPHDMKFVTFDHDLVRTAKRAGATKVAAI
jgi:predicted nucleic-acid-binding protein